MGGLVVKLSHASEYNIEKMTHKISKSNWRNVKYN